MSIVLSSVGLFSYSEDKQTNNTRPSDCSSTSSSSTASFSCCLYLLQQILNTKSWECKCWTANSLSSVLLRKKIDQWFTLDRRRRRCVRAVRIAKEETRFNLLSVNFWENISLLRQKIMITFLLCVLRQRSAEVVLVLVLWSSGQ